MENVKVINKFLESTYGRAQDNSPKFRLVWSEDLFEARKGLFGELAVFEEVKKVPKYSYLTDRWILEIYVLAYPEIFGRAIEAKKDIVQSSDGYEPLRVFQTKKGEYLKPDLEICKIICDGWVELVSRPEARRLTAKQADYNDVQKMRKETEKFYEILSADDSDLLSTKFRYKEAVMIHREEV